ncbi:Translation initiation factor eIF-1A [uncultured virus]|nr:Translation initiation factor eIF-1A [uncultured virus]
MPGNNTRGGKKHKKGKKKKVEEIRGPVILAENTQTYALVKRRLGGNRLEVECEDGKIRSAIIPGKLWKKIWLNFGDIILCDVESTGKDDVCYIKHKYTSKEQSILKSKGLIRFEIQNEETEIFQFEDETNKIIPQKMVPNLDELES